MCPDFGDFIPLRRETITTIRARMDADANAGLVPEDDRYIDTTPGGFYWDLTQVVGLEIERLWDMGSTEVPAVMFITYAWGDYLDMHGEVLGIARKPATTATGMVTFTGPDGIVVATGTELSTVEVDPDLEPVAVRTTATGTITGGSVTLPVEATEPGAGGNVAAGTLMEPVTPLGGVTVSNPEALGGGVEVESDEAYRDRLLLDLTAPRGAGNIADYRHMALEQPGVGYVTVEPLWDGNNTVRLIVMSEQNNPVGQSVVDALQTRLDPASASTTLSADTVLPLTSIAVADTSEFRIGTTGVPQRIHIGPESISYTDQDPTHFLDTTGGTGTYPTGTTVTQGGGGLGDASIGHDVMIATGSLLAVTVAASGFTFKTGYTLDGATGTIATADAITSAVRQYIDGLAPGEDVVYNHVLAAIINASEGVIDVGALTLNGTATNVVVAPLQVATADDDEGGGVTLS